MDNINLDPKIKKFAIDAQKTEITEYYIYLKLAQSINDTNGKILQHIAEDELKHYNFWKKFTKKDFKPSKYKIWKYYLISKIFGITFGIKLLEKDEEIAQVNYEKILNDIPSVQAIIYDENEHEKQLISLINEEKLKYLGSVVLGLNDALVELTGALAGLTLALQNSRLIALIGLITGIAASLSMSASEYLSIKSEEGDKNPLKAAVYTGIAYIITVLFLIFPYFIFSNFYLSLSLTLVNAVIVIFIFTFYISVVKDTSFKHKFFEMTLVSLSIAVLSFIIGYLVRIFLNVEI